MYDPSVLLHSAFVSHSFVSGLEHSSISGRERKILHHNMTRKEGGGEWTGTSLVVTAVTGTTEAFIGVGTLFASSIAD